VVTLVEFLRARLDEDEAMVRRNLGRSGIGDDGNFPDYRTYDGPDLEAADDYLYHFRPTRELADVAAKRAIVDLCEAGIDPDTPATPGTRAAYRAILGYMAEPFADHADYRQEWKP
jgi:hypothetical protein